MKPVHTDKTDNWVTEIVPAFLADNPAYTSHPALFIALDAIVRHQEEQNPDLVLNAAFLQSVHQQLLDGARELVCRSE